MIKKSRWKKFQLGIIATLLSISLFQGQVYAQTDISSANQNNISQENNQDNLVKNNQKNQKNLSPFTKEDYMESSATQMAQAIRDGRVTSEQLVKWAYEIIDQKDSKLNAMITLRKEEALKEARELKDTGQPFYGVPVLMKGLGHTVAGYDNTQGFKFMKGTISKHDSRYTKEFKKAGFIILGQTNFPEFGLKNISDSPLYGKAANGLNPLYHAGGSSGGSGAGIAAHYAPVASGSDAGGSIRIPSSYNGTIGLKPSQGVLYGTKDNDKDQTVHFPLTKSMVDTERLFDIFGGSNLPKEDFDPSKIKIAYTTKSPVHTEVSKEAVEAVNDMVAYLKKQGFSVEEAEAPVDGVKLMNDYYTIAAAETYGYTNYLSKQKLKRNLEFNDVDPTTYALYGYGKFLKKEDVDMTWESIHKEAEKMKEFRKKYDIYLTPTTAYTAPYLSDTLIKEEDVKRIKNNANLTKEEHKKLVYDQWLTALAYTPFTQLANLMREPAISLPTYITKEGKTLGVQFQAGLRHDKLLLSVGKYLEDRGQFYYQKEFKDFKENVINKIGYLDNLTKGQKDSLTAEVNSKVTKDDIEKIYQKAKELDKKQAGVTPTPDVTPAPEVKAGWQKDEVGTKYQKENGSFAKAEWEPVNGTWYHFDENGYMQTGWLNLDGTWYYLNDDGSMAKDTWIGTYYVDGSGAWVVEGWQENSYGWWYQRANGTYPNSEWEIINGIWYYFDANGYMLKDEATPDGYYVDINGAWVK